MAKDTGVHGRARRLQRYVEQPRVGFRVCAERDDAGDAELAGAPLQPGELRIIAVEHHRAARLDARKDFRLGIGNRLDAVKKFQMHRLDGGDDGHLRPHHFDQRLDFVGMVHADLEDRKTRRRRASGQRQRHAPVIIEGCGRGVGLALVAEHAAQRLLGRGLADRAGDRDHLRMQPRARGAGEIDETGEHVLDHQKRRVGRELFPLSAFDHRQRRVSLQRGCDKFMPVMDLALDGKISFSRRDGAAVDGKSGDRVRQRAAERGAHRFRHRCRGP